MRCSSIDNRQHGTRKRVVVFTKIEKAPSPIEAREEVRKRGMKVAQMERNGRSRDLQVDTRTKDAKWFLVVVSGGGTF
jgi:hypothetical protein